MPSSGRRLSRAARIETMRLEEAKTRFLDHHRAMNHSAKQIKHYEVTFKDFDRFLTTTKRTKTTATLTTATFEAFASWLKEQPRQMWRGSTVRSMVGVAGHLKDLRAFVRWATEEELVAERVKVPKPKVPSRLFPILTDAELAKLWQCHFLAKPGEAAVRNRAIFALLLDTGMRLGECAMVTPAHLYPGFVRVVGKGDKERLCPLTDEAAGYLHEWLKVRERFGELPDDPTAHTIFQLTDHGVAQVIDRLARASGVNVFPHKIRHTAATLMLRRGMDLYTVKTILGHSSITTTEAYLSLCPDDIRAKHATGSPFLAMTAMLPQEERPLPKKRRLR